MQGQLARRAAARRLSEVLATPRLDVQLLTGRRRVASINANLWFGVKAGGSLAHTGGVANGSSPAGYDVDLFAPFAVAHLREGRRRAPVQPTGDRSRMPTEINYFRHDDALFRHGLRRCA